MWLTTIISMLYFLSFTFEERGKKRTDVGKMTSNFFVVWFFFAFFFFPFQQRRVRFRERNFSKTFYDISITRQNGVTKKTEKKFTRFSSKMNAEFTAAETKKKTHHWFTSMLCFFFLGRIEKKNSIPTT